MKMKRMLATVLVFAMMITLFHVNISFADATDPVVFTKELLPATSGQPRRIKLEAYTTGATSSSSSTIPADIVLVLDQSGSTDDTIDGQTKLEVMKTEHSGLISLLQEQKL